MAKIALDIDSTLHHYWDVFERVVRERHGIALPYERQRDWHVSVLRREELAACVRATHSPENILAAVPYPDAVETVREWHDQGHWIHVTSHRAPESRLATSEWLRRIGLPYDDLHCSYDKVGRCVELGVELLIDDSPVTIERGRAAGMAVATLRHPWNEQLEAEGVVFASDWRELRERLRPLLAESRP